MPKTKFQSFIFTLIMVFGMVYCMTLYNIAINCGQLMYDMFILAFKEMWIEYAVVFILIFFFITNSARKLSVKILQLNESMPILSILTTQALTVCHIVPLITLFSTFFHNDFTTEWFVQWIQLLVVCFPMALCLQIFLIGPLVRKIFRTIFRKQLAVG